VIVAAGLTPAWQQILLFDSFSTGEVNRAREAHWCASGKVLNAGIALHHLGGPSLTVALAGGPPSEAIDRELASLGVPRRLVLSSAATRVCTTILDRGSGVTTELVENARTPAPGEIDEFVRVYGEEARRAGVVVLTGSLPAGTPATFYRDLLERTPGRAVIDARGPELLAALELRPLIVKPNREELSRTIGRPLESDAELREAMLELHRRGAAWVVVSQGRQAVWMSSERDLFRLEPLSVETVNPIGCGDCLAAGIAWSLAAGGEPLEAVRIGIAAAAVNAAQLLPARLDPERVLELAARVRCQRS
jgi:tagatose 6-phosphate kinase